MDRVNHSGLPSWSYVNLEVTRSHIGPHGLRSGIVVAKQFLFSRDLGVIIVFEGRVCVVVVMLQDLT